MTIIDTDLFPRRSPPFSEHRTLQLIHSTVPPNQSLTATSLGSFQSSASGCVVALAELSPGASRQSPYRTCMSQGGVSPARGSLAQYRWRHRPTRPNLMSFGRADVAHVYRP